MRFVTRDAGAIAGGRYIGSMFEISINLNNMGIYRFLFFE